MVLRKGDMEKHAHCVKCGQGSTREELAKHMKVFHEPLKCECGMELEMEDMVSWFVNYKVGASVSLYRGCWTM